MKVSEMFNLQVRIPPELHAKLLEQSARESRAVRVIIMRALQNELAACKKVKRAP